jgi:diaminopimelate decarboxylase
MTVIDDLAADVAAERTPRRIFRPLVAGERLDHVAHLRDALGRPPVALIAGYSFKTNPREELVRMARERGFFAETISSDEVGWAARQGFAADETIYNGPEPLPDRAEGERLAFAFADSVEAFARNLRRRVGHVHGVRLRPSMINSRFGVPLEDERDLAAAISLAPAGTPIAVSYHARHEDYKGASWRDVADDVLQRAIALESHTRRSVVAFDVGGGWTPEEFDASFQSDMRWLVDRIVDALPSCTRLLFEAGQAICTPTEALLTQVVEVRERAARREAILDVGYPDWPEMHSYVHGLFAWRNDRWEKLGHGPDRLGGRTCLEYDLIEGLRLPADLAVGDRLLITDTGSYDHSMSFTFASGEHTNTTPSPPSGR